MSDVPDPVGDEIVDDSPVVTPAAAEDEPNPLPDVVSIAVFKTT